MITPPLVAVLAGLGISQVPVYSKVKIAIMSTGDELLDPSEKLQPGKIYNSSLYGLMARCSELGAQPLDLGIVPDEIGSGPIISGQSVSGQIVGNISDAYHKEPALRLIARTEE